MSTIRISRLFRSVLVSFGLGFLCLLWLLGAPPQAGAAERLKIAIVGALSGQFTHVGREVKEGVLFAADRINQAGGLLGKKVEVAVFNDRCEPERAKSIAQRVVDAGIPLVVGHLCSGASTAASDIYAQNNVIMISPTSTAAELTDRGLTNVFRTCGRDDMQGFVIAEHIARRYGSQRVGLLFDESVYSSQLAGLIKPWLTEAKVTLAMSKKVPIDTTDFSQPLDAIQQAGVQVLIFPGYPRQVAQLLKQASKRHVSLKLIGADSLMDSTFVLLAKGMADQVELSFAPDPSHNRSNRKLIGEMQEAGYRPSAFSLYSFAAVEVWSQAVKSVDTTDFAAVLEVMRENRFDTVLGNVAFDAKGDISEPGFVMYRYLDGEPDYIQ